MDMSPPLSLIVPLPVLPTPENDGIPAASRLCLIARANLVRYTSQAVRRHRRGYIRNTFQTFQKRLRFTEQAQGLAGAAGRAEDAAETAMDTPSARADEAAPRLSATQRKNVKARLRLKAKKRGSTPDTSSA